MFTTLRIVRCLVLLAGTAGSIFSNVPVSQGQTTTWDGKYSTEVIEVTVVYFLPKDREAISDWKDRVDYYCNRIEQFHDREFNGQSKLITKVNAEPFRSKLTTKQLRAGDANFIFFRTMEEVDRDLQFGRPDNGAFPILLVLSEINWKPLDDFYRVRPNGDDLVFEGNYNAGRHFPGAESGGARAVYFDNPGKGWGLVSADGWRVPYSGSDCVVYHEGVGHTIGLPHTDEANTSVMSHGQYNGWINESYVDPIQKKRIGWKAPKNSPEDSLFTRLRVLPQPLVPKTNDTVKLHFEWPDNAKIANHDVRIQTDLFGPWLSIPTAPKLIDHQPSEYVDLGAFDRPTSVSYRVTAKTEDGQQAELWGYFQVRNSDDEFVTPAHRIGDLAIQPAVSQDMESQAAEDPDVALGPEFDLLKELDVASMTVAGKWQREEGRLTSPKQYGARIELPAKIPTEYQLNIIVEPLDKPNGLILGQNIDENRFLVLLNYDNGMIFNAIENVDGQNVGNPTTNSKVLFEKNRLSQILCTVRQSGVQVTVDGDLVINWSGKPDQLSLSDYWTTPNANRLFLGAYDCRYKFHRATLRAILPKAAGR
jgi:hypothetical protein